MEERWSIYYLVAVFTQYGSFPFPLQNPLSSLPGAGNGASASNSERGSRVESPVDGSAPSLNHVAPRASSIAATPALAAASPIPEATPESLKQVYKALDKRRRNLEKRKEKLAEYKVKLDAGENLNKDQREAASHFEEVRIWKEWKESPSLMVHQDGHALVPICFTPSLFEQYLQFLR